MFKNLILYRIAPHVPLDAAALEAALQSAAFAMCSPTQERSGGFVPPRGLAHGAMLEAVGGHWVLRHLSEARLLPASVVADAVAAKCAAIEAEHGRRPGKREQAELRDQTRLELLPRAFTRQSAAWLWIDPATRLLGVDVASQARADDIVTQLVQAWPGLALALVQTATSARAAMAAWLQEGAAPAPFALERECELKSTDEQRSAVRYARHALDTDEVRLHIAQGKLPTRLALSFEGAASLVLTEALTLKKITLTDVVLDQAADDGGGDGGFDADVVLATQTLARVVAELVEVLDGDVTFGEDAPAPAMSSAFESTPRRGHSGFLGQVVDAEPTPVAATAYPLPALQGVAVPNTSTSAAAPQSTPALSPSPPSASPSSATRALPRSSWFPNPAHTSASSSGEGTVTGPRSAPPDASPDEAPF